MRINSLCRFFILLLLPAFATGQAVVEKDFTAYTTSDGLSDNTITGITQDATGYIWATTLSGLNRFDGSRFVQYHSSYDSLSPASEEMNGIAWLDKERLAVYNAGLYIINTRTGTKKNLFIPYPDKQYEYKFNMIVAARGDEQGNIFILTRSGFCHFDKDYRLLSRFDYYRQNQVASEHFMFGRELVQLDDRRFLITSIAGPYMYDKQKKKLQKMQAADSPALAEFLAFHGHCRFFQPMPGHIVITKINTDSIFHIDFAANKKTVSRAPFPLTEDKVHYRSRLIRINDSSYYLTGHNSGFYRLQVSAVSGEVHFFPEKYFNAYQCTNLLTDRDNHLWVATTKGLFRQDDLHSYIEVANLPASIETSFPGININAVYATAGKVYAGTRAKGGLLVFDKRSLQYEKQVTLRGYGPLNNGNIHKIASIAPSALLLGTGGPLFLYQEKTGKESMLKPPGWEAGDWTNDLYTDSRNNIWVSSRNIYRYRPADQRFSILPAVHSMPAIPVAIREDNTGNIWIAGHGIRRYNISANKFDFKLDSFPFIKMPDKQVTAMTIDTENNIWFSCFNNGLISYNIDKKTFRHLTRSDGLPDNNISSLFILGKKLWIACYSGLACMDLASLRIKSYGKEEGLPDMPVLKGSHFFYDSTERRLYIGYLTAIVRFNPYELLRSEVQPTLFIESVLTNNDKKIFFPGKKITTSWQHNDITIDIGSINFSNGNKQDYAYRIVKDSSSPWQQLGSQPSFSISNLPGGHHTIQVKITSLKNRWPEQVTEIVVEVIPPFWQRTGFRILMAAVILALLYWLISWRIRVARKKEMEKTQMEKLKADDYKNKFELEQISHYFSSSLADKKTEEEVLWDVAGNLIGRMNYVDCMLYLWNDDKTKMIQKAAYGPKGKPEYIADQVFDVAPGQGVVGYVMQTMQPVLIKDTRKDSRYRVDEAVRLSEVCVPIIHNNELLGIIDSEHHEVNYFSDRDIKILTTIATLIGNKLQQIRSEQILEVKQQELSTINEQLAEAKLSALQAQMNPHFVFNALNSIKRMILDGDNEKASRYLSKFALMIRLTLNHSRDIFVTLRENIEYLKTYLEMEQLRFDSSFSWDIDIAENIETEETRIPSLMIQPLVENAIWHGLMQSTGDKKLSVTFTCQQRRITCSIEDNGIGIREAERLKQQQKTGHRSVGLDNLRNRIHILNEKYGIECRLDITDLNEVHNNGSGTRAVLQFNDSWT